MKIDVPLMKVYALHKIPKFRSLISQKNLQLEENETIVLYDRKIVISLHMWYY